MDLSILQTFVILTRLIKDFTGKDKRLLISCLFDLVWEIDTLDPSDDMFSLEAVQKKFNIISANIDNLTDHDVSVIENYALPYDITPLEFEDSLIYYIENVYGPKQRASAIVAIFEAKDQQHGCKDGFVFWKMADPTWEDRIKGDMK